MLTFQYIAPQHVGLNVLVKGETSRKPYLGLLRGFIIE